MSDLSKIIDKIEKLLKLGTSSNPNEAAAALAMAQRLMEEHNISQGHLVQNQLGEAFVYSTQSVSKPKDWESALMNIVARAFGCRILWRASYSFLKEYGGKEYFGRFIFIGQKDRVTLAEYTATVLLRQLVKGRQEFSKTLTLRGYRGRNKTAQLDGYAKGWVAAVHQKVVAFANPKDIQDAIDQKVADIVQDRPKVESQDRGNGRLGNARGFEEGQGIDLHRPMNRGKETLSLTS